MKVTIHFEIDLNKYIASNGEVSRILLNAKDEITNSRIKYETTQENSFIIPILDSNKNNIGGLIITF